jgi:hypothetical protein
MVPAAKASRVDLPPELRGLSNGKCLQQIDAVSGSRASIRRMFGIPPCIYISYLIA